MTMDILLKIYKTECLYVCTRESALNLLFISNTETHEHDVLFKLVYEG